MKTIDLQAEHLTAVALTRREKLLRWANLVRAQKAQLHLAHLMERWSEHCLCFPLSEFFVGPNAFTVAFADHVFQSAGLTGNSAKDVMTFFELSQAELHEFSCNCGGEIGNAKMADRIAGLAEEKKVGFRADDGSLSFRRSSAHP